MKRQIRHLQNLRWDEIAKIPGTVVVASDRTAYWTDVKTCQNLYAHPGKDNYPAVALLSPEEHRALQCGAADYLFIYPDTRKQLSVFGDEG